MSAPLLSKVGVVGFVGNMSFGTLCRKNFSDLSEIELFVKIGTGCNMDLSVLDSLRHPLSKVGFQQ